MIAFLMLLSRISVPSWKKYNIGKESGLGGMTSQEYLFSGIWKQFGNVGEAVGWMTGFCVLMTKCVSHQRSFISCTPQICKPKSAWWWPVATLLVLYPSSGLMTVVGRPQFYDFVCWCNYFTVNSHDSPEAEGVAVDERNYFYNN